jgi:hypothetical protein
MASHATNAGFIWEEMYVRTAVKDVQDAQKIPPKRRSCDATAGCLNCKGTMEYKKVCYERYALQYFSLTSSNTAATRSLARFTTACSMLAAYGTGASSMPRRRTGASSS